MVRYPENLRASIIFREYSINAVMFYQYYEVDEYPVLSYDECCSFFFFSMT